MPLSRAGLLLAQMDEGVRPPPGGERRLTFPDLAAPATAAAALARLEEGHGRLRAALEGLGDELDGPRWTNWGELGCREQPGRGR